MTKKLRLCILMTMSIFSLSAHAAVSIAKVAEVYLGNAEIAHSDSMEASNGVVNVVNSAINDSSEASNTSLDALEAAKTANANAQAPNRDEYNEAMKFAQNSAELSKRLENAVMSEYKAAVAGATTAKALAVVAGDGAKNAENLSTNADALAAKFNFSIGPNDKKFLKEAAEKARALANEAAEKAEQAETVAAKTIEQVSLANKAALRAKEIVAGIKPYTGSASPK